MGSIVSEQTLLEGSWHAFAQAGRLLRSAVQLFDAGDASSGLVLAMLGREELGRSRLLRDCSGEVKAGKVFTPSEIKDKCGDHVTKQEASALSTVLRPSRDSALGKALLALNEHPHTSREYRDARKLLDTAYEAKTKRQPADRHDARCNSLYVDLDESGSSWNRPIDVSIEMARQQINDACNDYMGEFDRLTQGGLFDHLQPHICGKEMHAARQKMPPFELPLPGWPKFCETSPAGTSTTEITGSPVPPPDPHSISPAGP